MFISYLLDNKKNGTHLKNVTLQKNVCAFTGLKKHVIFVYLKKPWKCNINQSQD